MCQVVNDWAQGGFETARSRLTSESPASSAVRRRARCLRDDDQGCEPETVASLRTTAGSVLIGEASIVASWMPDGWYITSVTLTIQLECEEDGRWIAQVPWVRREDHVSTGLNAQ